jgi:glucokinase
MEQAVLGVDVGGTSVKARAVGRDGAVLFDRRLATPVGDAEGAELVRTVGRLARDARDALIPPGAELGGIGVVVPGIVDDRAGIVRVAVNLGWRELPLRERLRAGLDEAGIAVPLAFGHDVRAGALAEARTGAGADATGPVAFVPVGTGLAAAVVVDGATFGDGWAGEIGQVVLTGGPHAGLRVEQVASAGAVAARLGEPDARAAVARVRAGDPAAAAVWDECVTVLADAITSLVAATGCTVVVVGGGLAEAGAILFDPLGAALETRLAQLRRPALRAAAHGAAAGVMGAIELARDAIGAAR